MCKYIPKKQRFANLKNEGIKLFQSKINKILRKSLDFDMPKDRFYRKWYFLIIQDKITIFAEIINNMIEGTAGK
jgi:hypothetical protein